MAAISRRGQGGRIYNNTRARVLLRRMCVKPADLTTYSPLKISARPRTAHALPEHFRSPTQPRRTPAGCAMPSPPTPQPIPRRSPSLAPAQRHALPEHFRSPTQPRRTPAGCAMHPSPTSPPIPRTATRCLSFRSASGTKKRHRTVHVRCRMFRSTVVAVGHLGW